MHKNTKLTPVLRKQIFKLWETGEYSHRALGKLYHVDKRVIGRIIERGKNGDFSIHSSVNVRFKEKSSVQAVAKKDTKEKKPRRALTRKGRH